MTAGFFVVMFLFDDYLYSPPAWSDLRAYPAVMQSDAWTGRKTVGVQLDMDISRAKIRGEVKNFNYLPSDEKKETILALKTGNSITVWLEYEALAPERSKLREKILGWMAQSEKSVSFGGLPIWQISGNKEILLSYEQSTAAQNNRSRQILIVGLYILVALFLLGGIHFIKSYFSQITDNP